MAKLSPTGIAVTAFAVVGFGVWAYTSLQPEPTAEELENRSSLFGGPSTQETNDVEIERYGRTYPLEHIERVRLIGCEIAQQYFDRENTPDYNESPADVTAFHQRHCDIKP